MLKRWRSLVGAGWWLMLAFPFTAWCEESLLSVEPVSDTTTSQTSEPAMTLPPPEEMPLQVISTQLAHEMFPYYFSAYLPPVDKTEVDLGLILSASPGIEVAVGWGALEEMMLSAKMTVQGASSTIDLRLRYRLREELAAETKPALAFFGDARFLNHRTKGDLPENIFRGSRFAAGLTLSKHLGSLAKSLAANQNVVAFMNYFRLHAEVLLEIQAGREGVVEEAVVRLEPGARLAWETEIEPGKIYFTISYDSLPDWMSRDNYYASLRYFSHPDFAIDGRVGWIGSDPGASIGLCWIF